MNRPLYPHRPLADETCESAGLEVWPGSCHRDKSTLWWIHPWVQVLKCAFPTSLLHVCSPLKLACRVDPLEQLQAVFQEVQSLHRVFSATPIFGVEFTIEEKAGSLTDLTVERQQDDIEIVDADSSVDPHKAYFADR